MLEERPELVMLVQQATVGHSGEPPSFERKPIKALQGNNFHVERLRLRS